MSELVVDLDVDGRRALLSAPPSEPAERDESMFIPGKSSGNRRCSRHSVGEQPAADDRARPQGLSTSGIVVRGQARAFGRLVEIRERW